MTLPIPPPPRTREGRGFRGVRTQPNRRTARCPSDYQSGDELHPNSPYFREPPEGEDEDAPCECDLKGCEVCEAQLAAEVAEGLCDDQCEALRVIVAQGRYPDREVLDLLADEGLTFWSRHRRRDLATSLGRAVATVVAAEQEMDTEARYG